MLSVEIGLNEDGEISEVVEIYFDAEGLSELQSRLSLIQFGKIDHIHLMSESWGLGDLNEEKHKKNNRIAHHLQLTLKNS